jgi:hypothetical protein
MVAVSEVAPARTGRAPVPPVLFVGLTVAATGGPLALAALYVPGLLGDAKSSAGLVAFLGVALFVPAIVVWLSYSRHVVGPGGLTSFVESAVGRPVALVQAGLWVLSYLLYLVYTVTYVAYDLLPSMFPSTASVRPLAQVGAAVAVTAVALVPVRHALVVLTAVALAQLVLVGALVVVSLGSLGAPSGAFAVQGSRADVVVAGGNSALLYVCASLPLFLGGEVRGGSLAVRRGLGTGWALAAGFVAAATVPLAAAGETVLGTEVPGMSIAGAAGHPALADAIGVGVVASVLAVVVAEYLALSRLGHALTRRPVGLVSRVLAGVLLVGATVTLVNPERAYDLLLKPSLVALWLSQLVVFAVYPRYAARHGGLRARHVALAVAASALMLFGLWSTTINQIAS